MTSMDREDVAIIRALPGNNRCIDCDRIKPQWASVKLGILVCLDCSGVHRSLGTHVSFVRSVKMDSWSPDQIALMNAGGGNDACKAFLEDKGINMEAKLMANPTEAAAAIRRKYDSPAAQLYQKVLRARVDGEPEPTELAEPVVTLQASGSGDNTTSKTSGSGGAVGQPPVKIMEGFGSSPHPSEQKRRRPKISKKKIAGIGAAAIGAIATVGLFRKRSSRKLSGKV